MDNNIYLDFIVSGSQIIRNSIPFDLASGTMNTVICRFELRDDWEGINPVALFTNDEMTLEVFAKDNECLVPNEMMAKPGRFTVSVYGGDLKTTIVDRARITVRASGFKDPDEPPEPPPGTNYIKSDRSITMIKRDSEGAYKALLRDGSIEEMGGKIEIDNHTLIYEDNALRVNTTVEMDGDLTLPITSSGVYTVVGNINAILELI